MPDKPMKIPGPDHPISIEANPSHFPRGDVDMAALARSEHTSYCPYKGEASYYSIPAGGDRSRNAVWTYETPFEAMAQIKEYVAFYPDRVDEIR
jgi:uncharacterized protein (DUF427 family)